jgi:hypothetical protein
MNPSAPPAHLIAALRALRHVTMHVKHAQLVAVLRLDPGLLDRLCRLLEQTLALPSPPIDAQIDLVWTLTNIAGGSSSDTLQVVQAGALPLLARIVQHSQHAPMRDQATWALGNIAGDSASMRDQVRRGNTR